MTITSDVSLLITHYNRPNSLERQLRAYKSLGFEFAKVVVSDDASQPEHLEKLKNLQKEFGFQLVTTPFNMGLGNNINKGQDQINTPYTLYVQEDFVPTDKFPKKISEAFEIMNEHENVDLIRFFIQVKPPALRPFKHGFSEMRFRLLQTGTEKFFCYSDTPHLRRSNFFEKFGRYRENVRAIKCEKAMVMSFLQSKGKGLVCDTSDIFFHDNPHEEPSTQDYSKFIRIKQMFPEWQFDFVWMLKLTFEYFFVSFRS